MKNQLKNILLLCTYSILLVVFRVFYTQSGFYLFMVWNLFLASIPYVTTTFLKTIKRKRTLYITFPIWLVFLPNAPYILTDLVHLHQGTLMPVWFDLLLISSFTISGMMFFFLSINDMFLIVKERFSNNTAWFLIVFTLFLSSFGIYLGRFLRWNSWDIIQKPQLLINDILTRIINPMQHPKTWGITLGFGMLFLLVYIGFKAFINEKTNKNIIDY